MTVLLAALLGVNRLFVAEREQGGFDGFLLAPVDRTSLLLAKAAALYIFLVVLEVVAVPAFGVLLLGPSLGPPLLGLIAVLALANLALAVIGTLVSAIAVQTRARDLIGPIIALPLLIPALIATARAAGPLLAAHTSGSPPGKWILDPGAVRRRVRADRLRRVRFPARGLGARNPASYLISPRRIASATAAARSATPSFSSTLLTWVLTVEAEMNSCWPISGPERPSAIRDSTWDSRPVSRRPGALLALAKLRDEAGLDLLGEHRLPARDGRDRVADLVDRRCLGQEPSHAEPDHVVDQAARAVGREHHDPRGESLVDDRADDVDAVERRQRRDRAAPRAGFSWRISSSATCPSRVAPTSSRFGRLVTARATAS